MSGKGPRLPRVKRKISKPKEGQCVESEDNACRKTFWEESKIKSAGVPHSSNDCIDGGCC